MFRMIRLLFLAITVVFGAERNKYTLTENKYGDILIAISEDVPENPYLVQKIKDAFILTSRDLFVATRRRASLGNITILVPKSWSRNLNLELSSLETFDKANIIVDKPNPQAQDNPYVNQPGKCGEPGKYMHLTPEYLTNRRLARQWGPTGKTILHEFGHLRWGFFDEYPIPDEGYKRFYHTSAPDGSAVVEPVRCSKAMFGEIKHGVTGQDCKMDAQTSLPEAECNFFPPRNKRLSPAKGSLMFWHFMSYVDGFCDNDPSDTLTYHNDEAPNKHNRLCKGKSQWEMMREHEDFKDNNNQAVDSSVNYDTTPNFRVIQKGPSRLVFVIDVSGSMSTNNRLTKATQAASEAIRDAIDDGTKVAIVKFSTSATTEHPMIEIADASDRQSLINKLPTKTTGSTAIGKGLLEGMKVLENNGGTRGGKLILLSDGQETIPPYVKSVEPNIIAAGVIIDTIPLSDAADSVLISLASKTGGVSLFTTDSDSSTSLVDAFTKTVMENSQKAVFVKIFGDTVSLKPQQNYSQEIFIDNEIGNNTEFVITWQSTGTPQMSAKLLSPSGSSVAVPPFTSSKSIRISIPGVADTGAWRLEIQNNHGSTTYKLQLSATSRATSADVKPITLTSELSGGEVNFNDTSSLQMIIFATLTKGYSPVVDAEVIATVENAKSSSTLKLLDNGAGPDTTKGDGIYSGYFLGFEGNGGYSVKVKVQDKSGKARLKTAHSAGQQSAVDTCFLEGNCSTPQVVVGYAPVNPISRVATAGSFQVFNQPATSGSTTVFLDLFEPSAITDLEVVETNHEQSAVTLRWTAVGDDLDKGQATRYDLRMHSNINTIRNEFGVTSTVRQDMISQGDLSQPKLAGEIETFVVRLDPSQNEKTYFFAVKAIDDTNKTSDISNIVPVAFTTKQPPRNVGIEPEATTITSLAEEPVLSNEAIIGISFGAVAFVVLFVTVAAILIAKKQNGKVTSIRIPSPSDRTHVVAFSNEGSGNLRV